jgi:hypothetical protein
MAYGYDLDKVETKFELKTAEAAKLVNYFKPKTGVSRPCSFCVFGSTSLVVLVALACPTDTDCSLCFSFLFSVWSSVPKTSQEDQKRSEQGRVDDFPMLLAPRSCLFCSVIDVRNGSVPLSDGFCP